MRAKKGSKFERTICKQLSRWWTGGKRDDVFWRSSQSGGRATMRTRKGQTTFGSYGDITAVDPIGRPLLDLFTIELKRGNSHGTAADLLDFKADNSKHPFTKCLAQTIRSAQEAGTKSWLLIVRRDCREAVVYTTKESFRSLIEVPLWPMLRVRLLVRGIGRLDLLAVPLSSFLKTVDPRLVMSCHKQHFGPMVR